MEERIRNDSKDKEWHVSESLVEALKSVVNVKPAQITKKKPLIWNKESLDDYKIEVEAWEKQLFGIIGFSSN